jgi:hypothetical protein
MYLKVEVQVWVIFGKEPQELDSVTRVIVEGAVKHTHIADAPFAHTIKAVTDILYGKHPDGVTHSTDTKGTRIETPACGLYLHEGLPPREQRALLRSMQRGKVHDTSMPLVIAPTFIYITEPHDIAPSLGLIPHIKPLGKALLALATKHTIHLGVTTQILFITTQELGTAQHHHCLGQ